MPQFRITDPSGKVYNVKAPEGATKEQALAKIQEQTRKSSVDSFLANEESKPQYSKTESFGRGVAEGASFGFKDEIEGATFALAQKLGLVDGDDDRATFSELYKKYRDADRQEGAAKQDANPISYGAGDAVGTVATAAATGGSGIAGRIGLKGATTLAGRVGQVAGQGAAFGGARAAGDAEELSDVPGDALKGAAVGAVAAPVAGIGAKAGGSVASGVGNAMQKGVKGVVSKITGDASPQALTAAGIADILFAGGLGLKTMGGAAAAKAVGNTAQGFGHVAMGVPVSQLLQKYPALQEAAQKGANALTSVHFVMLQTDPDYRREVEEAQREHNNE